MPQADWLLLLLTPPGGQSGGRIRLWRTLRSLGAAALRDSTYLLPYSSNHEAALAEVADSLQAEGGEAQLLRICSRSASQESGFRALFERDNDYQEWLHGFEQARREWIQLDPPTRLREYETWRHRLQELVSTDFFPAAAFDNTCATYLAAFRQDCPGHAAPNFETCELDRSPADSEPTPPEPAPAAAAQRPFDPADYQNRVWALPLCSDATILASAWLICRHIDSDAQLIWLADTDTPPSQAVRIGVPGAPFGGEYSAFADLCERFGLDKPLFARLDGLTAAIDSGDLSHPQAAGIVALLAGIRDVRPLTERSRAALQLFDWLADGA